MRIYLDHAATTPLLPGVAEAMSPWLGQKFGNPSSLYAEGRQARSAIDSARETLSQAIGCEFGEIVFTSGGTEAANMAIIGCALANENPRKKRVLFGAAEHHCVLNTQPTLERLGYRVETIPVDRDARPDLDRLKEMMASDVLLISVMAANNELGTIVDTTALAKVAQLYGAVYFCDAVQLPPLLLTGPHALSSTSSTPEVQNLRTPIANPHSTSTSTLPGADPFLTVQSRLEGPKNRAQLVALAAHKMNGPKGVGALVVRAGTKLKPIIAGGGQERELRAGTENVAAIVGFAEAVRIHGRKHLDFESTKSAAKQMFVETADDLRIGGLTFTINSLDDNVLSGHMHIRIEGVPAETLLILLDRLGVCASSGAACSSGSIEPSHVLLACGFGEQAAREGLRFSFGVTNTTHEAAQAAEILAKAVTTARGG